MKTMIRNPFITSGYVSADYFCDRRFESEQLEIGRASCRERV